MINGRGEKELGADLGGVFRDAVAGFWTAFYDACTVGEEERVPSLRHDFQIEEWEAVARILVKGFFQAGYFPIKISKIFMIQVMFGEEYVNGELLFQSFLKYLSKDERQVVEDAVANRISDEKQEEWEDFLDRFHCKRIPKGADQVKEVLIEISHKELIQMSEYVTKCWNNILHHLKKRAEFQSVESLLHFYCSAVPSTRQVIALLKAEPNNNAERDVFGYLKRYVRGLQDTMLSKFLRFCTGSDVICTSTNIVVSFNGLEGAARRVVAHTCGLILEVPRTYESFPEFRKEMNNILNSGVWDIDFV